ncbi:hypothetical protein VTJ49DRAFT_129 [Mycothermus thermophilus]|uniref:R3H domain-containing protein n=1 Tax=Humicola insolens TaxID=85995 RepID=A0ABR3VQ03_HUMIN
MLPCGEHFCSQPCHAGLCGSCEISVPVTCYCGKEQRMMPCSQRGEIQESFNYGQRKASSTDGAAESDSEWFEGSFSCGGICGRPFDCGVHVCRKPCHAQDEAVAHCPFSPDLVTHCPCGKTSLASMGLELRQSCQDPVPHCDKPCNKALACGHLCPDKCHTGACAPCTQRMQVSCRCGKTTVESACHQGEVAQPQCFRICRTQKNCGRHECGERCCPGEKKAAERRKQRRSATEHFESEHICLQLCGRLLKCGKHTCQQLCHKGPCLACLEAVFEEVSCACGRTVLQPPQPCGTRPPECRFPCTKPRSCGHPAIEHQCHPDDVACPKCPFLVERHCICGKKKLMNQPCWKPCHKPGECEDANISGSHCSQPCGKMRKSCEHPCVDECHAPFPCKEDKPCQSKTFLTCPCQRRKQEVRCLASRLGPPPAREPLKCDDECLRLQRNRKLAEALNIDPNTHTDDHIPYSDTTLKLFRENMAWAQEQERELRVFAATLEEKRIRFKPMPAHQRAFIHNLAADFGFDTESMDPEPHRHVCVFKTPRFVSAPPKTLAQCLRIAQAAANLGIGASAIKHPASKQPQPPPFNALLMSNPRFGLTIDELDAALTTDLATASRSGPAMTFTTSFLPSEEVIIKAIPGSVTVAAIATSLAPTPEAIEKVLTNAKPGIAKTVSRLGLAGSVTLCHIDGPDNVITRREADASSGGWSAVASRGSWRKTAMNNKTGTAAAPAERRAGGAFVALRKLGEKKAAAATTTTAAATTTAVEKAKEKEKEKEEVAEDWLAAVEREEGGAAAHDGKEGKRGEKGDATGRDDINGIDGSKGDVNGEERISEEGESARRENRQEAETLDSSEAA